MTTVPSGRHLYRFQVGLRLFFLFAMPFDAPGKGRSWGFLKTGSTSGSAGSPLQVDQDNNLVVAGTTDSSLDNSTNSGGTDAFLMKFTSNGTWLWTVQRGGSRAVFMQAWSELLEREREREREREERGREGERERGREGERERGREGERERGREGERERGREGERERGRETRAALGPSRPARQ